MIIRLADSRTSQVVNTGAEGSRPTLGSRAVFFEVEEARAGRDLNGDGDARDRVLSWTRLPGVTSLEPGIHHTGGVIFASYYSARGEIAAFLSDEAEAGQDLNGDGRIVPGESFIVAYWLPTGELYQTGSLGYGLAFDFYAIEGSRIAYSAGAEHRVEIHDFTTSQTRVLPVHGYVWGFQANTVHYWNPVGAETREAILSYYDLTKNTKVEDIGRTRYSYYGRSMATSDELVVWTSYHGEPCYPEGRWWLEYHRISTRRSYSTGVQAITYAAPAPSTSTIPLFLHERLFQRDLNPGPGGIGQNFLGFYVPPCETFDHLKASVEELVRGPTSTCSSGKLERLIRKAHEAHAGGRSEAASAHLCSFVRSAAREPLSRTVLEVVRTCAVSVAAELGLSVPGDKCSESPDHCGLVDTMQDDFDGDGWTAVCDNCPDEPNSSQEDTDGDGIGDPCDSCPQRVDDWVGDGVNLFDCDFFYSLYPGEPGPGIPDAPWADCDDDGLGQACDNCPGTYNPAQEDVDRNGVGDRCEVGGEGSPRVGIEAPLPSPPKLDRR